MLIRVTILIFLVFNTVLFSLEKDSFDKNEFIKQQKLGNKFSKMLLRKHPKELKKYNKDYKKVMFDFKKTDKEFDGIIYLTSSSVPKVVHKNIRSSIGLLNKRGQEVKIKFFLQGMDFENNQTLKTVFTDILTYSESNDTNISNIKYANSFSKGGVDPRFFEEYNIKKAPAILVAKCKGKISFNRCKVKYVIKGDVGLLRTFTIISQKDDYYSKFVNAFWKLK